MSSVPVPKMTRHKASGQAVVRLGGKDFYLGPWQTRIARTEYDHVVAEWLAAGRQMPSHVNGTTIAELIAAFWDHAQTDYRHPDGTDTGEAHNFADAMKYVRRLYGHTAVIEFGPLALKAVRQSMIDAGLSGILAHVMQI